MEQEKNEGEIQIDLGGIFFFILRKWWIVLICLVVGCIGGFSYGTVTKTETYSTNATILASYYDSSVNDQTTNQTKVASILGGCVTCVKQNRFAKTVANAMNANEDLFDENGSRYNISYSKIMSRVEYSFSVASSNATSAGNYIYITSTSTSPKEAYDILMTITELFSDYINENYPIADNEMISFSCVNDIDMPTTPVSDTSVVKYTLIAGLGLAVLSVIVLAIIVIADQRVKGEDDLIARYNIAVLGSVPDFDDKELVKGGYYYAKKEKE